jgi:hypothetical protein
VIEVDVREEDVTQVIGRSAEVTHGLPERVTTGRWPRVDDREAVGGFDEIDRDGFFTAEVQEVTAADAVGNVAQGCHEDACLTGGRGRCAREI